MQLPTIEEIEAIHHKYSSSDEMFDWVYVHCQAVWSVAEQLIERQKLSVDSELVRVGCLLHDVGVYALFDEVDKLRSGESYITHGVRGGEILKNEGCNKAVQRFASCHTGVGIKKEEIEENHLPLPSEDLLAETIEERLVMYADKFHSKEDPLCFNSYEGYRKYIGRKFGEEKAEKFVEMSEEFGVPHLEELSQKYGHPIRDEVN